MRVLFIGQDHMSPTGVIISARIGSMHEQGQAATGADRCPRCRR